MKKVEKNVPPLKNINQKLFNGNECERENNKASPTHPRKNNCSVCLSL